MSSPAGNVNAYLRTKVTSASPEELRLMLLDGAIKFATQGRDGLLRKDFEAVYTGFSRCRDILVELTTSMRPEIDPELCRRVGALYTFMYTELLEASMNKDITRANKVIELLQFERETWAMLMAKLAEERAGGRAGREAVAPGVAAQPVGAGMPGLGSLSVQA